MVTKKTLLSMIDHCLFYSGESYGAIFYDKYKEIVNRSLLSEGQRADCIRVLERLSSASLSHLERLRKLRETIQADGKTLY